MPDQPPAKRKKVLSIINPILLRMTNADLYNLPPENMLSFRTDPRNDITLPDLHGNALKLVWYLAGFDMLMIDDEQYKALVAIYQAAEKNRLTAKDLTLWSAILNPEAFEPHAGRIRLIGDELCDRGANDWLTLTVIERLHEAGMLSETVMSNHSLEFMLNMEIFARSRQILPGLFIKTFILDDSAHTTTRSMENLRKLLDQNQIRMTSESTDTDTPPKITRGIFEIYRDCWLPHLRVLHLITAFDPPLLFTHAPFDVNCLWELGAQIFQNDPDLVSDECESIAELDDAVFKINFGFAKLVSLGLVHTLLHYDELLENRFKEICWNRNYQRLTFFGRTGETILKLTEVHGHDSDDTRTPADGVFVLDDTFGKGDSSFWTKTTAPCLFARKPLQNETASRLHP